MPTILKIGYQCFLVPKAADAAKVVTALAGAVSMQQSFDNHERFFPAKHSSEISLQTISQDQILARDPKEESIDVPTVTSEPRRLNGHVRRLLNETNL